MTGFDVFRMYTSMKIHFAAGNYDYFKYIGKTKIGVRAYESRNDRHSFMKLAKRYSEKELLLYMAANFAEAPDIWIRDLVSDEARDVYLQHLGVAEALEYNVKSDWNDILIEAHKPGRVKAAPGSYPLILRKYLRGETKIETMVILNAVMRLIYNWDGMISDTVQWPQVRQSILKFTPFVDFEPAHYRQIFLRDLTKAK